MFGDPSFPVLSYRTDSVRLIDQYQYPDTQEGDEDAFAREPFVVHFQAPKTGNMENIHCRNITDYK